MHAKVEQILLIIHCELPPLLQTVPKAGPKSFLAEDNASSMQSLPPSVIKTLLPLGHDWGNHVGQQACVCADQPNLIYLARANFRIKIESLYA